MTWAVSISPNFAQHPSEESHVLAMALYTVAMSGSDPLFKGHEYRRVIEDLPEGMHVSMTYHVRAAETLARLFAEKGLIDPDLLRARIDSDA
jgi:hypothetical protein